MAYEELLHSIRINAAGDLSANQFLLHSVDANGRVAVTANTSTLNPVGVLQNKPDAIDQEAQIAIFGVSKVVCGETIAAGDLLCPSSVVAGKVDDADTATDTIIGVALQGGAVDEIIAAVIGGVFGGEVA